MSTKTDVELATNFSQRVYETAKDTIQAMQDGERMQIKELAKAVGTALSEDPKVVLGFVSYFAHRTSLAYVTRGKNGGIIRGTRPIKVIKAGKKQKKMDTSVTDTSTSLTTD
jgi:hypothetical protein